MFVELGIGRLGGRQNSLPPQRTAMRKRPGDAKDPCEHFSEVPVDPFTLDDSNVEESAMPCMEIVDSDDDSDDDIR